ncbi:MAG: hypothetical protein CL917_18215 [Deltaproteobacteria bacterium]|nr:hypothetical protein [Deltaproteobacteria bacterium]
MDLVPRGEALHSVLYPQDGHFILNLLHKLALSSLIDSLAASSMCRVPRPQFQALMETRSREPSQGYTKGGKTILPMEKNSQDACRPSNFHEQASRTQRAIQRSE